MGTAAATPPTNSSTDLAEYRTPHKYGKLVLDKSSHAGSFDSKGVDCPFVFSVGERFYMTYVGFDGIGYQTGLAHSDDLMHWTKTGLILGRDPKSKYTRYNVALTAILRDDAVTSAGSLKKIRGRYLGTWHAYPEAGYETGAAVIGLAWSDDLRRWDLDQPILLPADGAPWERGGLYKSYLVEERGTFYLFYNAKDKTQGIWHEQIGVATSKDLKAWHRHPGNPIIPNGPRGSWDERFASDPFVLRRRGEWAVFYFGLSKEGRARELLALGTDPYHLRKVPEIIIDIGSPGSIDDRFAHKAALISSRGDLYHFYTAASGNGIGEGDDVRGISVARSRPWR